MVQLIEQRLTMTEGIYPDVTFEACVDSIIIRQGRDSIVIGKDEIDLFVEGLRRA